MKIPFNVISMFIVLSLLGMFSPLPVAARGGSASSGGDLATAQLDLYANIETVGVVVNGTNLPQTAQLMYRQGSDPNWHTGHPLLRIEDGRLVGSLFGLSPATSYSVKVSEGTTEISGSVTTQPTDPLFSPTQVVHVNASAAPGGDGSAAAPFRTIQDGVNHAGPGTQVLVADGVYHEAVTFPASGSAGNWIQVKAEGNGAVLDGSETLTGNVWKEDVSKAHIWFIKIGSPIGYLARDQKRFYAYDTFNGLSQGVGHGNVQMREGWYYEPSTTKLYVRSLDDPAHHTWQVPRFEHAFDVNSRDWIWIEGFQMQYYGVQYSGCGVCTTNASHIVIRRNRIHGMQLGIYVNWTGGDDRGNDTRIEFNDISDPPVNEWPWQAVKSTTMEGTAIVVRGHIGAIVRGNELHNMFNGIYTGASGNVKSSALAFDADIYNNNIHDIGDDALEPEGPSINQRFRNNTVSNSFVGVSLAPITIGPVWVLRSTFTNFFGRGVKWDQNSDGIVLMYHNTFWSSVSGVNAMDMISPVSNATLRNNIFQSNGYSVYDLPSGLAGHDWNYDNWYTTRSPHFVWGGVSYNTLADFCAATGLDCTGHENPSGLANPGSGNLTLLSTSPNIDRGVLIPGINDNFSGRAPDIGAFESATTVPATIVPTPTTPPAVASIVRADPNPTRAASVNFTVTFTKTVTGVDTTAPFKDFVLTASSGVTGAFITSVVPVSETTYMVNVNTGSGNGTIRLDLLDDNSITDSSGNPLGGVNVGDGNFNFGESYTVERPLPAVTAITLADPNPTSADVVHFTVTFNMEVSGVDAGDFALTTSGVSSAVITEVGGYGTTYAVTVNVGTGDGTLRLDLVDDDSILDANNDPLGGVGAGNGTYSTGDVYAVNKSAPFVTSILLADPSPTTADSVRFSVNFSEAVSGVDNSDFALTASGVEGARVVSVSGASTLYTVTVSTGSGNGTLRLDVMDNDSIVDAGGLPLGGVGTGNGNFTGGAVYTVNKPIVVTSSESFRSNGRDDGWVLESGENSNKGGSINSNDITFNLGDDYQNRQYRAILHFQTSSLPDNAVITMAILMIKRADRLGTDPFTTHGNILVDIRYGAFGNPNPFGKFLQTSDFQAASSQDAVGVITNNPVSGWYWTILDASALRYINRTGYTQFRLRYQLDDNNDGGNDYLKFFSGDYGSTTERPQLMIEYYTP